MLFRTLLSTFRRHRPPHASASIPPHDRQRHEASDITETAPTPSTTASVPIPTSSPSATATPAAQESASPSTIALQAQTQPPGTSELPAAAHRILEHWNSFSYEEQIRQLSTAPRTHRATILSNLTHKEQRALLINMSRTNIESLLALISPDDLVDIMRSVSTDIRHKVFASLPTKLQSETKLLLQYDSEDAGGVMTSRYLAIRADLTVDQALQFIQTRITQPETIYYIYVIDGLQRLIGVVSLRQLLQQQHTTAHIADIMQKKTVFVSTDTDKEIAAQKLSSHRLLAIPVCDDIGRILGIITFDDIIDVIRQEQTEDLYKMGALQPTHTQYLKTSNTMLVLQRIPWLILLLCVGTITTNLINRFDTIIMNAIFIVWFIPVITQTGGNSGTQSATIIIRGLAIGEISWRHFFRVVGKELIIGLSMGIILALVIIARGLILPPVLTIVPLLSIALSLAIVVVISSVLGAIFPLLLSKLNRDPAVMAGPLMSTVIDFFGILTYLLIVQSILV